MQGQNTREPPPVGGGSFLRGTKNDQEIFPEAFWEIPKFFFRPGRRPGALRSRFMLIFVAFWADFVPIAFFG